MPGRDAYLFNRKLFMIPTIPTTIYSCRRLLHWLELIKILDIVSYSIFVFLCKRFCFGANIKPSKMDVDMDTVA